MPSRHITSPDSPAVDELCRQLAELAAKLEQSGAWPAEQLRLCGEVGVFEWFVPREQGGQGWSEAAVVRGYLKLSAACLTTTFVITQRSGAMSRIAASDNEWLRNALLPDLISCNSFATVGISHLTTSRQHLSQPMMRVTEAPGGFVLDGYSPWVTGAEHAELVVIGGSFAGPPQILVALPTNLPGVRIPTAPDLVALTASRTGSVYCDQVFVERKWLLAGPVPEVMKQGAGAKTGGLQTSTLAIGLATAAVEFLEREADMRSDLMPPATALRAELTSLTADLLALADGQEACTASDLRARANSFVLRATQSSLAAAKGAGFVAGHAAGRWCREALFFLVWSCPQGVLNSNLCELAGIE
ncbi:MAG: acyl-CoA/acyl-ACP dehydrogenase [Pirellulaceae bacterium]|nr:acyl-CoA/acyl-ACP dehydrogenase [Pirellulaceae bacterium]